MRLPFFSELDPADQHLTPAQERGLFVKIMERLNNVENSIANLNTKLTSLETEFAAGLARVQSAHDAELAGHQADLDGFAARVDALHAKAAALGTDPAPGALAQDAVDAAPGSGAVPIATATGS